MSIRVPPLYRYLQRPEKDIVWCGHWKLNPWPLCEQWMLLTSLFGERSSPCVLGQLQCYHDTQVSLELVVLLSLFLGWWQSSKWKKSILKIFGIIGLFKYLFSLDILAKFVFEKVIAWERYFSFRKLVGMINFAATALKLMIIRVSWMSWLLANLHRFTLWLIGWQWCDCLSLWLETLANVLVWIGMAPTDSHVWICP